MNPFFKELFEYTHYVNQKLANAFTENPDKISENSVKLFNHILNAHQIWNNRIEPKQKTFGVWEIYAIQDFVHIDKMNFEHSIHIVDKCDLNKTIQYTNSQGHAFSNNVRDLLFHVINHSSYHRGQIATDFKQSGLDPLVTDYIFYKR